jgi:hypothetical protein
VAAQDTAFDFGPVEPGAVLGRVVKLEPLEQTPCFFRRKGCIKGGGSVRVPIVQHHRDPFRGGVVPLGEFAHRHRPIGAGAPLRDLDLAPTGEWFGKQKQMGYAMPFLFVILALGRARGGGQSQARFADQWLAGLIPTDYRTGWVPSTLVDRHHIFPRSHKGGAVLGPDRPIFF